MTKKFRILETLDEWGDRIWKVEVTTPFRPWWRKVQSYYNKNKATEALRILTNPEKEEIKENIIISTWVGLTDEEVIKMSRYDLEYAALIGEVQRKLKEKNT